MKINGDGFLSESGRKQAQELLQQHEGVFEYLEFVIQELRGFATSVKIASHESDEDKQKVIALVLTVRLLEISEAALLIMKHGMSNEANSMFRIFLDAYFVIANICSDTSFVANYIQSDKAARLKLMNSAERHKSDLFKSINDYATEAQKAELAQQITEENIQAFSSYAYAEKVGCSEIYDSVYRLTSPSLHTTPRSLQKYVEEDEDGNVISINDLPDEGDIAQRLYELSWYLIFVLGGLKNLFNCLKEVEQEALFVGLNEAKKGSD